MEVILYSKECNWYTRCCPLNGGVRYRECPLYCYYPLPAIANNFKMVRHSTTDHDKICQTN